MPMVDLPADSDRFMVCILDSLAQTLRSSKKADMNGSQPRVSATPNGISCEICMPVISLLNHDCVGTYI
jgi:hypothetical protein